YQDESGELEQRTPGLFGRIHHGFQNGFNRMREGYRRLLAASLAHRKVVVAGFFILGVACASLFPFIGSDFFPPVDAGQIRLHVRAPAGTRIEETEVYFSHVEDVIRRTIPANELADILDNIGL